MIVDLNTYKIEAVTGLRGANHNYFQGKLSVIFDMFLIES